MAETLHWLNLPNGLQKNSKNLAPGIRPAEDWNRWRALRALAGRGLFSHQKPIPSGAFSSLAAAHDVLLRRPGLFSPLNLKRPRATWGVVVARSTTDITGA